MQGEKIKTKNGNIPLASTNSRYQLSGTFPSNISISDIVKKSTFVIMTLAKKIINFLNNNNS